MQTLLRDVILLLFCAPVAQTHDQRLHDAATRGPILSTFSSTPARNISASSSVTNAHSAVPTLSGVGTCSSRTVNYITHTLPQQCLRTDRASTSSTRAADANSFSNSNATIVSSTSLSSSKLSLTDTIVSIVPTETTPKTAGDTVTSDSREESASSSPSSISSSLPLVQYPSASTPLVEIESDSPLDNANFLSFEDWKRQNLAKAGQSPDNVGRAQPLNAGRQRPGIDNVLDTFGDENEISLDFSGFGAGAGAPTPSSADFKGVSAVNTDISAVDQPAPASLEHRSKDAGTTCKERTNYASFDCAANVLKSNRECKSASAVLVENKDSYMLNICSASDKFFIVELCDDILVDTVVLANYEFFSSSFRHFRVSVSDRYPAKVEKWRELGTYEARNTREIQAFLVENPLIWARYLRIEFLTQYGNEYYCPVSLLRVHGTTMIQEYLHHEESTREENANEGASLVGDAIALPPVPSDALAPLLPLQKSPETDSSSQVEAVSPTPITSPTASTAGDLEDDRILDSDRSVNLTVSPSSSAQSQSDGSSGGGSSPHSSPTNGTISPVTNSQAPSPQAQGASAMLSSVSTSSSPAYQPSDTLQSSPKTSSSTTSPSATVAHQNNASTSSGATQEISQASGSIGHPAAGTSTDSSTHTLVAVSDSSQSVSSQAVASSSTNTTPSTPATSTSSQPAQPSTQESFFKSVHKRLQQLESNSTLSLQYIEEQSRILRDAFSKVEKRQVSATTTFLSNLNQTVMGDLHGFRQAYDQLWQSTVIELEGQREQFAREMLAMSSRLTLVADELVWQKRMGIVQSTLVLMCLALVLFGRSGTGTLELPIMQQMMHKSTAALRAGWESPPNSPSPASRSPVGLFRHRLWRASSEHVPLTDSDGSRRQSVDGPDVMVGPPTPATPDVQSDADEHEGGYALAGGKPLPPASPPQPKKRRKRRPSSASQHRKAKSPLDMIGRSKSEVEDALVQVSTSHGPMGPCSELAVTPLHVLISIVMLLSVGH